MLVISGRGCGPVDVELIYLLSIVVFIVCQCSFLTNNWTIDIYIFLISSDCFDSRLRNGVWVICKLYWRRHMLEQMGFWSMY